MKTLNQKISIVFYIIFLFINFLLSASNNSKQINSYYQKAVHFQSTDFIRAKSYADSALSIAQSEYDTVYLEKINGFLGKLFKQHKNYYLALNYYRKAIIYGNKNPINFLEYWHYGLIYVYYFLDRFEEALRHTRITENLSYRRKKYYFLSGALYFRGLIYADLNLDDIAEPILNQCYKISTDHNILDFKKRSLRKLASILAQRGNYKKARKLYKKALVLETNHISIAYGYKQIGNTFFHQSINDSTEIYFKLALHESQLADDPYTEMLAYLDMAQISLKEIKYDKCKKYLHQFSQVNFKYTDAAINANYNLTWGDLYLRTDKPDSALIMYRKARYFVNQLRSNMGIESFRIGFLSEFTSVYNRPIDIYLKKYQSTTDPAALDSLFLFVNLPRSRSLSEMIHSPDDSLAVMDSTLVSAENHLQTLQRKIRHLPAEKRKNYDWSALQVAQINVLNRQIEQSNKIVKIKNPDYNVSQIQNKLADLNTAALIYFIHDSTSFVFYLDKNNYKLIDLHVPEKEVEQQSKRLLTPFYKQTTISQYGFDADAAYNLYNMLLVPVIKKVQLPRNVIIIPDDAIASLRFEFLLNSPQNKSVYYPQDNPVYSNSFLVNQYNFSYHPTIALIIQNEKPPDDLDGKDDLMIAANPSLGDFKENSYVQRQSNWNFDPLIYSHAEAISIHDIDPQSYLIEGDKATKQAVIDSIGKYKIIHFATHTFIDTTFSAFSGLVFTCGPDSNDDGFLLGYELNQLRLNAALVTLSACEASRGKIVNGEGLMALPRIFIEAGARSVITTAWNVDDRFASEFMPVFYTNLLKKNLSKTRALAEAKRYFLDTDISSPTDIHYQHPIFWAPFTLFGDPSPVNGHNYQLALYVSIAGAISVLYLVAILKRKHII